MQFRFFDITTDNYVGSLREKADPGQNSSWGLRNKITLA